MYDITFCSNASIALKDLFLALDFIRNEGTQPSSLLPWYWIANRTKRLLTKYKYITKLLQKSSVAGVAPVSTYVASIQSLFAHDGEILIYRQMVGYIEYVIMTRSDISFAVGLVIQYMQKPRLLHLLVVK